MSKLFSVSAIHYGRCFATRIAFRSSGILHCTNGPILGPECRTWCSRLHVILHGLVRRNRHVESSSTWSNNDSCCIPSLLRSSTLNAFLGSFLRSFSTDVIMISNDLFYLLVDLLLMLSFISEWRGENEQRICCFQVTDCVKTDGEH